MSKLEPGQGVTYDVAMRRALVYLFKTAPTIGQFAGAAFVAGAIWPDHQMKAQGAGAAASRILKRMDKEGYVRWHSTADNWGYSLTSQGRIAAQQLLTEVK